jgi:hypothetical protein
MPGCHRPPLALGKELARREPSRALAYFDEAREKLLRLATSHTRSRELADLERRRERLLGKIAKTAG